MKRKLLFSIALSSSVVGLSQNQLPNNSFEQWRKDSVMLLDGYQTSADYGHKTIPIINGVSGNYGVLMETEYDSLSNDTSAGFIVNFDPDNFTGGVPFTFHADSICGYYKANIINQDTAWIFTMFKFNGSPIGGAQIPITAANNTTTWRRFSVPTGMPSFFSPDSMMFGAVSSNYLGVNQSVLEFGSQLMLDSVFFKTSTGGVDTIYNYDFERWTARTRDVLLGYQTSVIWDQWTQDTLSVEMVATSTNGTYAVKLNNVQNQYGDTIRGNITTGSIRNYSWPPVGGTPFDWSPISLTYDYQCYRNGDVAYVDVVFKNNFMIIDQQSLSYLVNTGGWVQENVTFSLSQTPDTLYFNVYNGSNPGSWFIIDNVMFNYPVGINENLEILQAIAYPNPSFDNLNFKINAKQDEIISLEIIDAAGKLIISKQLNVSKGNNQFTFDVSKWAEGVYYYTFKTSSDKFSHTFIKQ